MLGLGVGASAMGAYKLMKLLVGGMQKQPEIPAPVVIPLARHRDEDTRRDSRQATPKYAAGEQDKQAYIGEFVSDLFSGRAAESSNSLPYGPSARAAAFLAALGAGAYGTHKMTSKMKNMAVENELERARKEFEEALRDDQAPPQKPQSGIPKLAHSVARIEKAAEALGWFDQGSTEKAASTGDLASKILGAYALMALTSAGVAGYHGYQQGLKSQKGPQYELAHRMKKQRDRRRDPYRPVVLSDEESEELVR